MQRQGGRGADPRQDRRGPPAAPPAEGYLCTNLRVTTPLAPSLSGLPAAKSGGQPRSPNNYSGRPTPMVYFTSARTSAAGNLIVDLDRRARGQDQRPSSSSWATHGQGKSYHDEAPAHPICERAATNGDAAWTRSMSSQTVRRAGAGLCGPDGRAVPQS